MPAAIFLCARIPNRAHDVRLALEKRMVHKHECEMHAVSLALQVSYAPLMVATTKLLLARDGMRRPFVPYIIAIHLMMQIVCGAYFAIPALAASIYRRLHNPVSVWLAPRDIFHVPSH